MEDPVKEARFLTAAEVAEILKLNHQVLVRKLQAGEIPAYKIGKDWRIEERELRAWLDSVSNRAAGVRNTEEEMIRHHFFEGGKLKTIPARRSKRETVLRILARRFERGRFYRESEVNEILKSVHADFCTLRRELIMARLLAREKGRYWRVSDDGTEAGGSAAAEPPSSPSARRAASGPPSRT